MTIFVILQHPSSSYFRAIPNQKGGSIWIDSRIVDMDLKPQNNLIDLLFKF